MFLTKYHKLLFNENTNREKAIASVEKQYRTITFKRKQNDNLVENALTIIKDCLCLVNEDYKNTKPLSINERATEQWEDKEFEEKLQRLRSADGKVTRKLVSEWVNKSYNLALQQLGEDELLQEKLYQFILNEGFEQLSIFDKELSDN